MTAHTPANRRRDDAEESRIMALMSQVDRACLVAIRAAAKEMETS